MRPGRGGGSRSKLEGRTNERKIDNNRPPPRLLLQTHSARVRVLFKNFQICFTSVPSFVFQLIHVGVFHSSKPFFLPVHIPHNHCPCLYALFIGFSYNILLINSSAFRSITSTVNRSIFIRTAVSTAVSHASLQARYTASTQRNYT